jgi:mRNA interferase MazF
MEWAAGRGSEQAGRRPALVVQNDGANQSPYYSLTIVVALSTKGKSLSFHVPIAVTEESGLRMTSFAKCEQIATVACERLVSRIGIASDEEMARIEIALHRVLALRQ